MNAGKLIEQGFMHVSTFNQHERAEARAAFYRKQGHDSNVVIQHGRSGIEVYSVYMKLKEA